MNRRQALISGGVVAVAGLGATALSLKGTGTMSEYDAAARASRSELSDRPQLIDFIRMATLAANGHNVQPWRFLVGDDRIEIRPDFSRRTPAVDPDDHHLFVGLGCAAENLAIAAAGGGYPGDARFVPSGDGLINLRIRGRLARRIAPVERHHEATINEERIRRPADCARRSSTVDRSCNGSRRRGDLSR